MTPIGERRRRALSALKKTTIALRRDSLRKTTLSPAFTPRSSIARPSKRSVPRGSFESRDRGGRCGLSDASRFAAASSGPPQCWAAAFMI
jgi:hypothetical protein